MAAAGLAFDQVAERGGADADEQLALGGDGIAEGGVAGGLAKVSTTAAFMSAPGDQVDWTVSCGGGFINAYLVGLNIRGSK